MEACVSNYSMDSSKGRNVAVLMAGRPDLGTGEHIVSFEKRKRNNVTALPETHHTRRLDDRVIYVEARPSV